MVATRRSKRGAVDQPDPASSTSAPASTQPPRNRTPGRRASDRSAADAGGSAGAAAPEASDDDELFGDSLEFGPDDEDPDDDDNEVDDNEVEDVLPEALGGAPAATPNDAADFDDEADPDDESDDEAELAAMIRAEDGDDDADDDEEDGEETDDGEAEDEDDVDDNEEVESAAAGSAADDEDEAGLNGEGDVDGFDVEAALRKTGKQPRSLESTGVLPAGATATTVRFDQLTGFLDEDPDAEFRGGAAEPASASDKPQPDDGPMIVETSDSDTEDDMHSTNTVGNVPAHWYDDETHVGYDLDGKKIGKSGREKDRLDKFLQKIDDPDYGRTIVDPLTKKEIVLTDEEVDMIKRIQGGEFPDAEFDPYEDYIDFFTYKVQETPLSSAPEPKRRFVPSKHEHKLVMRIVRGLRKGWLKPKPKQRPTDETEFFDIWKNSEAAAPGRKALVHIAAPKVPLPGHAESYNPPAEYLLTPDETKEWEEMDPEDRPRDFLPKKYSSLRLVPAYPRFLQERFSRCLDLYLCPRTIKHRIHVDPESLIPKLPKPDDLRPFPTKQSVEYRGHSDRVTCISVDPTGRWLLTGSEDKTAVFWEVRNGRRAKVVQLPDEVTAVEWCPNPAITVAAISFGTSVWIVNPGLGSRKAVEDTDAMLSDPIDSEGRKSAIEWTRPSPADFQQYGLRFVLTMTREVTQVTWHKKGNYFASVCPTGVADSVAVHSLLRRHSAYHFKKGRDVQRVSFHPTKPLFFLATKTHVRVYNLQTNVLVKKLTSGSKWISSIAVHPQGDNVIIGTLDRRLCWFDLDLSTKPYKTLRYHKLALRSVAFHGRRPLFASTGDEGAIHIFHGMVYSDLMQNPLLVPVKILRGHTQDSTGLGVLDCCFHPTQPWLFSAGADGTARLFTDA